MDDTLNDVLRVDYALITEKLLDTVTFEVFIKFFVVYFFIIWISIIIWVIKDINNRTTSVLLQIISIMIILFLTPFSIFLYLLIRPSKTLFEKQHEEVDYNINTVSTIVEERTDKIEESSCCFKCNKPVATDFKFCPNCRIKLKIDCKWCKKLIYAWWDICPYCWNENDDSYEELEDKNDNKKVWNNIKEVKKKVENVNKK